MKGEEETETKDDPKAADTQSETKKEDTASSPSKDEKKPDEKASEESGKEAEGKAAQAKDEQTKPPKGFVPIQALHQERGQRQLLTQEVQTLRAENTALKSGKVSEQEAESAKEAEFEVLSEEDFNELLGDDPVEAIKYERKLRAHEAKQADQKKVADADTATIEQSLGMMATAIPGLYDTDSDVNQKLSDFAVEKGFADLDGLALVTDPRTKIIPTNGGNPQLLGDTAANLVIMLNTLFQEAGVSKEDPDNKELTEKLRGEITKELLAKIKKPAGAEHKSLGDIPGDAGSDLTLTGGPKTEADFAKLSEDDQQRLLGG